MEPWSKDDLTQFFDAADRNRRANRERYAYWYDKIARIDASLVHAGKNLINTRPVMAGPLLNRCQYALKTATGHALAGQVVECFVLLRTALEYAGYALRIFETPSLESIFLDRHMTDAGMAAMKKAFKVRELREAIARYDKRLADNFDFFYQRTIDFGGHPNPHGILQAMDMEERDGKLSITTWAMTTREGALEHALKSTAQIGLTVLYIFQHIFKAKFEILGIRAEIEAIRNSGDL